MQFDRSGESETFVATRKVCNSEHANGSIEIGAHVFFRRDIDGEGITLIDQYGEPTNGNQYARWPNLLDAEAFANWVGLVGQSDV